MNKTRPHATVIFVKAFWH